MKVLLYTWPISLRSDYGERGVMGSSLRTMHVLFRPYPFPSLVRDQCIFAQEETIIVIDCDCNQRTFVEPYKTLCKGFSRLSASAFCLHSTVFILYHAVSPKTTNILLELNETQQLLLNSSCVATLFATNSVVNTKFTYLPMVQASYSRTLNTEGDLLQTPKSQSS